MASRKQTIRIKLISHTKQFRKRLKDSGKSIKEFVDKTHLLSIGLGASAVAMGAAGAAVLALGAAYSTAARIIPELRLFFDMARDAGISAETFQVWAVAAQRAGIEMKSFGVILRFTDTRIRQFKNGQGELTSSLKKASQETQDYFEELKKTATNDEFYDGVEKFLTSTASATDKSTLAVGLWTEGAGRMLNAADALKAARKELVGKNLLITNEEAAQIRLASDALADIRRETNYIAKKAVADNVDAYIESAYKLEELRRTWYELLVYVGEVGIKVADYFGLTSAGELANALDKVLNANALQIKYNSKHLQEAASTLMEVTKFSVNSKADLIKAQSYQTKLKEKQLELEGKIEWHATAIADAETALQTAKGASLRIIKGTMLELKKDEALWRSKLKIVTDIQLALEKTSAEFNKQKPKIEPAETGYYAELLKEARATIKVNKDAQLALARLKRERAAQLITLEVYTKAEEKLNGILKVTEGYYGKAIRQAQELIEKNQDAESALAQLNARFDKGKISAELYAIAHTELTRILDGTRKALQGQLSPMDRVIAKLNGYRKSVREAAAEAAAVEQLIASGEQLTAAELKAISPPPDNPPEPAPKLVWELDSEERTELFLRDFQSFSGQLSEAMLDTETDWDKFWLNMIKRMNQRNLARYINDAFESMITSLKENNKELVDETKKTTENLEAATGGKSNGAGGWNGWGSLFGAVATLGSAYLLSRNMNNASAAAATAGAGGDVEIVVNINNTSSSRVAYDGRQITEQNGIRQQVINIVVDDYQTGGAIRQAIA